MHAVTRSPKAREGRPHTASPAGWVEAFVRLDLEELSTAELLVARIAANTSASAALAFSGHFLAGNFGRALSTVEARICDGALLILARTERLSVRAQLSAILASVESGPVRTVTHLAYDLDVEVAAPLLRHSPLIAQEDLVAIARTRPQGHLTALARRTTLGPALAGILRARGGIPVLQALAGEAGAQPEPAASGGPAPDAALRRERSARMTLRLVEGGRPRPDLPERAEHSLP